LHQFNCDSPDIVVIVSVRRDDLRDEFAMADEAFALSPIAARATQPREEDYDAIREAFMETSRGRWFLGEYAKRNRNADTRMVLDAVARIEETIAAQKPPPPEPGLAEALAAIGSALDEARATAAAALDSLALEESLAPVRKGARVIKEIAWRWREIGADGRICDLLDSQVGAIEGACRKISSSGPRDALSAAFDLLGQRIAAFGDGEGVPPRATEEAVRSPASPMPSVEMLAAVVEEVRTAAAADDAEAAISNPVTPTEAVAATTEAADMTADGAGITADAADATAEAVNVMSEVVDVTSEAVEVVADVAGVTVETGELTAEAADADQDAVLEMVALEMAAPDPGDNDDISEIETTEIHARVSPPADPEIVALPAAPVAAPAQPPTIESSLQPSSQPSVEPSHEPSLEPSLGSSLIASGIVRRPQASASDPLAPIRRLSQAEKIAFFS
jgi:hypothetical protein